MRELFAQIQSARSPDLERAITESSDASGFYQKAMNWRQKVKDYLKSETQG